MTPIHPDEVLKALLEKGHRSDKESKLCKLHELCLAEYNRYNQGSRDLSIANMARIAESHKLFKQKTIWNAQSADYVTLIKAWDAYNGPKPSQVVKRQNKHSDKYAFLESIQDPAVRSICQIALGERDKLRAELNMLKAATVWPIDMRPREKGTANCSVNEAEKLTDSERNALTHAIDARTLGGRNWHATDTGAVIDERGRPVYDPGYITGISKVLGFGNTLRTIESEDSGDD